MTMEIRIKESVVKEREEIEEVYTPEKIRELWSDDTPASSLVLALLEKWEQAESRLVRMTAVRDRLVVLAVRSRPDSFDRSEIDELRKV